MRKTIAVMLLFGVCAMAISALSFDEAIKQCDEYYDQEKYDESLEVIEPQLRGATDAQKVAIYWRMSRAQQKKTWPYKVMFQKKERDEDGKRVRKNTVLDMYDVGIEYATKAIELYEEKNVGKDEIANAYHWRAVNVGQWGQTKGIFASLFRADDMKRDLEKAVSLDSTMADSYYVLCSLYTAVPMWDKNQAVEYGRRAVELENQKVASGEKDEFYQGIDIGLAEALVARGWDADKRGDGKSDEEEARELIMPHKKRLEAIERSLGRNEKMKTADAQALLDIEAILDDID